jgi:predicted DCC family thiol-disulfide oxidoreductase YuxK
MPVQPARTPDLTLYFDGLCVLCSAEMEHYRRRDRDGRLALVDIAAPDFDATALGLEPAEVQRVLHGRLGDGTWLTGVDTFVAIWERLPGFRLAARLAKLRLVRPLLDLGYRGFVRVRPYLPRRAAPACESGRCDLGRRATA